jgi:predicted negative regulator of RcsB-dependent stress response
MLAWLHANQKKLIIGGCVVAVIVLAGVFVAWQKTEAESSANARLLNVPLETFHGSQMTPTPAGPFLDLAKQSPNTEAGEYAAMLGAKALFTEGKYPEAHQEFSKFIEQYPDSPLFPQARVVWKERVKLWMPPRSTRKSFRPIPATPTSPPR